MQHFPFVNEMQCNRKQLVWFLVRVSMISCNSCLNYILYVCVVYVYIYTRLQHQMLFLTRVTVRSLKKKKKTIHLDIILSNPHIFISDETILQKGLLVIALSGLQPSKLKCDYKDVRVGIRRKIRVLSQYLPSCDVEQVIYFS